MLICAGGNWFETWRGHWKLSDTFRSAGFTLWGVSAMLNGLNLGPVPDDISGWLMVVAVCLLGIGAFMMKKDRTPPDQASTPNPPAPDSSGPQFQGYLTKPRI